MRITGRSTCTTPPRWCFLKTETDAGLSGWGKTVVEGRAHTGAAAGMDLAGDLLDADPGLVADRGTARSRAGRVATPPVPGLALPVDEDVIRRPAETGHRRRNPVWRHADGSPAEG